MDTSNTRKIAAKTLEKWEAPVLEVIPVKQTQAGGAVDPDAAFDFIS